MARILLTSGPTRQYLDPVRFLSNASSGQMGTSLAAAALKLGHEVVIVSGPVQISYPSAARVIPVISTEEMLAAALQEFPNCDGVIGVAAPCDYRPVEVATHKLKKTGDGLIVKFVETPDVLARLGQSKQAHQWIVGFALETQEAKKNALAKLQRKNCDLMVLNDASAINSNRTAIEIMARDGSVVAEISGSKLEVADKILAVIQTHLMA